MRRKEDILLGKEKEMKTDYGVYTIYTPNTVEEVMDEYAKETSIEFFKWYLKYLQPIPQKELEERYNLFIKSLEEK